MSSKDRRGQGEGFLIHFRSINTTSSRSWASRHRGTNWSGPWERNQPSTINHQLLKGGAMAVEISCRASLRTKHGLDGGCAHAFPGDFHASQPDSHSDVCPWLHRNGDARLHL